MTPRRWLDQEPERAVRGVCQYGSEVLIFSAIAAAVAAAGTATSAVIQGQRASASAKYQREVAQQQEVVAGQAGAAAEQETRDRAARVMALQRAGIGAGGIDTEGSPLMVLLDTASQAELQAQRSKYDAELAGHSAASAAQVYGYNARTAQSAGYVRAGTTLLTGASNFAGNYYGGRGTGRSLLDVPT